MAANKPLKKVKAEKPAKPTKVKVAAVPTSRPSVALYLSGLIVMLCGIQAVNLTVDNGTFTAVSIALTVLGFVFSFGCRLLNINMPAVQFVCVLFVVFLLNSSIGADVNPAALFQPDAAHNDYQMAILLACGGVVWSWLAVNDDLVAFSCVLTLAMLGLIGSQNINEPIAVDFCIMVVFAVFLIIHHNYLQNRAMASEAEKNRPMGATIRAQFIIAILCWVFVMAFATVLIIPAQVVFSRLSLAQAMNKIATMGAPGHQSIIPGGPLFSDDDTMALGGPVDQTSETLLHVQASDGLPHYWVGRTYDEYNGDGWRSTLTNDFLSVPETAAVGDRDFTIPPPQDGSQNKNPGVLNNNIHATVDVKGITPEVYYPGEPFQMQIDARQTGTPVFSSDGDLNFGASYILYEYTVVSHADPDTTDPAVQEGLRRAGTIYPPLVKLYYMGPVENDLTLKTDRAFFHDAVQQAVANLPENRRDPYDVASAIRDWVSQRCVYSLTPPAIDPSLDHVHAFLGTTRVGYCDMYASSMAVLCRTAGLPARLATGFDPGTATDAGGYDLTTMDKHAWVQVYFPGYGWINFDPTIGTRSDGSVEHAVGNHFNWVAILRLLPSKPVPLALTVLLIGLGGYLIKVEGIDRLSKRRRLLARKQASQLGDEAWSPEEARVTVLLNYQIAQKAIAGIAGRRRAQETPLEYERRINSSLRTVEQEWDVTGLAALFESLTAQFMRARYDLTADLTNSVSLDLDHEVDEFRKTLLRAQWLGFMRRPSGRSGSPKPSSA